MSEEQDLMTASDPYASAIDLSDPEPGDASGEVFDFGTHEKAQRFHSKGIWTDLGVRWGGLHMRIRPFHVQAVVVRREQAEQHAKIQLGLREDQELPADKNIDVNRASVTMAITGARGKVKPNDKMLAIAKKNDFKIQGGDDAVLVELSGDEDAEHVREFFAPVIAESMPFLTALIRASQQLQTIRDEKIVKLGEDFVLGHHVALDWSD